MNYYERYCGDYQRDTAHLSLAEHGAYTMLLDTYFSVEKPLPSDLPSLYRVCRAMTRLEQQAVKAVAEQFFPVSEVDGLRHNRRADREIAKARPKIEAARINGRKGGRPPNSRISPESAMPAHGRQDSVSKPGGFSPGYPDPAHDESPGLSPPEPGGKALQHQRQLQPQPDSGMGFEPGQMEAGGQFNSFSGNPLSSQRAAAGRRTEADAPASSRDGQVRAERLAGNQERQDRISPGQAEACCGNLRQLGVRDCNPRYPAFLGLLRAGAAEEEFSHAARVAAARGKASFAYVVGIVKRQREEERGLVLHQGRVPNRQEQLEAANGAAAERWLPPEMRGEGFCPIHPQPEETGDANR